MPRPIGSCRADRDAAAKDVPVKKLIVIGVVALVLAGGAGGGAWWWMHRAEASEAKPEADAQPKDDPADTGVLAFDPFLVNLADKDSPRFLRTTLRLVVQGKKIAAELGE